jgi:Fe-coproporphyrin III synthase
MLVQLGSETAKHVDNSIHVIKSLPVLVLNVHSRCNCRCVMCDIWRRDDNQELSLAAIERHRRSLRNLDVRWVVLSGGEPLLHSNLVPLCAFFRELGIRVTLLTTGLRLAEMASQVAYNVDEVIISLDGPREVHDSIRRVKGAFQLIANGVVELLSRRPEMQINARTTVQKANHNRLLETIESAMEMDLSGISFLGADLTSEAFNRSNGWSEERKEQVGLDSAQLVVLEREIETIIESHAREIQSGYIAESPAKLRKIVEHFRAHRGIGNHRAPMCNAPWVSAVIEHDGSVRPCFFHRPIGNAHVEDLETVLNSPSAIGFRASLDMDHNPTCQRCVCSLNLPREMGVAR